MESLIAYTKSFMPERIYAFLRRALMPFYRTMYKALYYGRKYTCPCCGKTCRRFIPRQRSLRRFNYGKCPHCLSWGRHRSLWFFLHDRTNLFQSNCRLLHVAPEPCFERVFRDLPRLEYVSLDLNNPAAMVRADITDLPFDVDTFDAILCVHVLEHIDDDRKAMRELLRVLKPGGWAVVQAPIEVDVTYEDSAITSPAGRKKAFGQVDHVRRYGKDYFSRLEEAGFIVEQDHYVCELAPSVRDRYGLGGGTTITICRKPVGEAGGQDE